MRGAWVAGAVLLSLLPVTGGPVRADTIQHRLDQTASDLEDSTAKVRAAAAGVAAVEAALPAARLRVAEAQGRLAGAQARVADATAAVRVSERAQLSAQEAVAAAGQALATSQAQADLVARRNYEQGGVEAFRALLGAKDLSALADRAALVRHVLAAQTAVVRRLALARARWRLTTDVLAGDTRTLADTQAAELQGAQRAADVAAQALAAADAVTALLRQRAAALASAQADRAADLAAYREAQAASARLAAQLKALADRRRLAGGDHGAPSVGRLLWPTDGPLTSRYGMRRHPIYGDYRFHAGIDIGAPMGQVVWAASGGVVVSAGPASGYGTLVVVDHGTVGGRDLATAYAHMSALLVRPGQTVARGQAVGRVGSEGNSTGPHLHFEVRRDGDPVDPLGWVSPP